MNLGKLIEILKESPPSAIVQYDDGSYPEMFESWRGRYHELTLCPGSVPITAAQLLQKAEAAVGQMFEGYKGGEFVMNEHTAVWADDYGESLCRGILATVSTPGEVTLVTADLSDYLQ